MTTEFDPVRRTDEPDGGLRLLVRKTGGDHGASARLRPPVGLQGPRYWYHVGQVVHAAPELHLFRLQRTLLLGNDLTGRAELLDFDAQGLDEPDRVAAWSLLAREALAGVARDPGRWGRGVIAELPGVRDASGRSPFWQGLTRHFYRGDPQETAARLGEAWRSHVAALLPRQSIHVSFLPEEAQRAIGGHAQEAAALHAALHAGGLRWRDHVAIDDGGAVLEWTAD